MGPIGQNSIMVHDRKGMTAGRAGTRLAGATSFAHALECPIRLFTTDRTQCLVWAVVVICHHHDQEQPS